MNLIQSSGNAVKVILLVSLAALGLLFWLVYFQGETATSSESLNFLPGFNAFWNGISAFCMSCGLGAILKGKKEAHKKWMLGAFISSSLFLVGYLLHHYLHGDTKFLGGGWIRSAYFFILVSHILLSVVALPLILLTFYFGLTSRLPIHKKLARYTFPLWFYISVTGVMIYFLLRAYS